jgi:hypothetical protein
MTATGISLMHAGPNQGAFGPDIDHSARRRGGAARRRRRLARARRAHRTRRGGGAGGWRLAAAALCWPAATMVPLEAARARPRPGLMCQELWGAGAPL